MDVVNRINRGFTQEFQKFAVGSSKLLAVFCKEGINWYAYWWLLFFHFYNFCFDKLDFRSWPTSDPEPYATNNLQASHFLPWFYVEYSVYCCFLAQKSRKKKRRLANAVMYRFHYCLNSRKNKRIKKILCLMWCRNKNSDAKAKFKIQDSKKNIW